MILATVFSQGKSIHFEDLEEALKIRKKGELVWIYSVAPSEAEKAKLVKNKLTTAELLKKFEKETRSTRYSIEPLKFTIIDYYLENEQVESSRILFTAEENTLLTVTGKKSNYYAELFERVVKEFQESSKETLTVPQLLYEFLAEDINDNYDVLQKLEDKIIHLEEEASKITEEKVSQTKDILSLKRQLYKMSRRLWATTKVIFIIRKSIGEKQAQDTNWMLEELYDTLMHQIDNLTVMQEMLTDVLTVHSTSVSNEIGKKVKKLTYVTLVLTGIATVISIPNTVATIFGIPHFPQTLIPPNSWPIIILLIALSSIIPLIWMIAYWNKHGVKIGKEN